MLDDPFETAQLIYGNTEAEMPSFKSSEIILIGQDLSLVYLITRYADLCNLRTISLIKVPSINELKLAEPAAVIFLSIDQLQKEPSFLEAMPTFDFPVLVCTSTPNEAVARDLGVDGYLLHPLTLSQFRETLSIGEVRIEPA